MDSTDSSREDEQTRQPFADGHGLVGGHGEIRAQKRRFPPLTHRWVLRPYDEPADLEAAQRLCTQGPVEVEIGFGRGHFLRDRIRQAPDRVFFGFEIRLAWCRKLARFLDREDITNTRVLHTDARPLLLKMFPEGGVDAFYVFFPDPWWKKRHHKRRVMSDDTIEVMHRLLRPGGAIELRTDVADYADMVREALVAHGGFDEGKPGLDHDGRPLPLTHREKKCAEAGAPIHRLRFIRRADS